MTLGRVLLAALVVSLSLMCVRLGFWQLSRWGEKRALNADLARMLEAPPLDTGGRLPDSATSARAPLLLRGRYDSRFEVLLRGRPREGEPGVIVATPFVLAAESVAVMVERGWLAAADAATLPAKSVPVDRSGEVVGLPRVYDPGAGIPPMREMGGPERHLWSAPRLDYDSLSLRIPHPLAPFVLRALPGHGAPGSPRRDSPHVVDEAMHLGYAMQWFAIAILVPVATWLAARSRRRSRARPA